jgi:hypothetical protein
MAIQIKAAYVLGTNLQGAPSFRVLGERVGTTDRKGPRVHV